jgi:hypothetical protein
VIDSSLKSVRRSSYNSKKLRQTDIARSQGRQRPRQFKQDIRQRLRLGYRGRRRRLRRLLNKPCARRLAELINDSNKLSKRPRRVRSAASRLLQSYLKKESCHEAYR